MNGVQPPNTPLKMFLLANNIKNKEVAEVLGITPSLFSQKINENRSSFSLEEVRVICRHYNLNMHEYFFDQNVLKTGQN